MIKQVSITIVVALIFICGINQLAKNSEGIISVKPVKGMTATGFSAPIYSNGGRQTDKFYDYFPADEVNIILDAAERNGLTPNQRIILFAIRKAENGGPGKQFGIMNAKANTFDLQAGWCAATIKKNYQRWEDDGKQIDFVTFLGNRYCPVGVANDPQGLNSNWVRNVKSWIGKLVD